MKVLFLTDGGKKSGFGHITRCIGLAQGFFEFAKKKSYIDFFVYGDKSPKQIIEKEIEKKYRPRFRLRFSNWIEKAKYINPIKKSDIVIIDSYLASKKRYFDIHKTLKTANPNAKLVCIDDYNRIQYPPNSMVINPSIYGDKLKYPKGKNITYLLGKEYIILRKPFWKVPKRRIKRNIKDILITLGGIKHVNFIKNLMWFLIKEYPQYNYHIVGAYKLGRLKNNPRIKTYSNLTALQMRNLMLKCDLAISAGGQTTYELARVGIPTIGICFAENQLLNLEYGEEYGYLKYIGWYNQKEIIKAIKTILNSLNYEKRILMNNNGRRYVNNNGVRRIINKII